MNSHDFHLFYILELYLAGHMDAAKMTESFVLCINHSVFLAPK
jgi:hypothetical protein